MTDTAHHDGATACVSDVSLATYVDGRATADERRHIEAHVSSCDDCYLLLSEVLRTEDDLAAGVSEATLQTDSDTNPKTQAGPRVLRFPRTRNRILAASGLAALAASLVLFVLSQRSPLDTIVSIVGDERLTLARPTGGFRYGPLRSTLRSGAGADHLTLRAAEGELRRKAAVGGPEDVHAFGVAQLLLGNTTESVRTLESAVSAAPGTASYHADLGAAQLTVFLEGGRPNDGTAALASLDRSLALDPGLREARFNRALLLAALDRTDEAVAAWDEYLALDARSPWAEEARRQRQALSSSSAR